MPFGLDPCCLEVIPVCPEFKHGTKSYELGILHMLNPISNSQDSLKEFESITYIM